MLFLVIERFKDFDAVRERFAEKGRMMPDNITYVNSWITQDRSTCYQIMEAERVEDLAPWADKWSDIVDFEIVPVMTSAEFNKN
jgi:hypothetical protein